MGFPAAFDLAGLEPWDTITIQVPDIYGNALTCVVTSITIGGDMTITIQADAYTQVVGALTDWTPSAYVTTTGGGDAVPTVELFPVSTVQEPTQWDAQLTVDGQKIYYWYGADLWVWGGRLGGVVWSVHVTEV
ncbi:hypothetical protein [Desulfoluna spongiiphila]|uniref:hypothetical protein n=1 Tax=Desulfoluna spongiiphila TaxID=419481 RepID=UPI00125B78C6|nr:hypothetical protein [Desulfoluna spongiiphila]VVS95369.1 hypothetical protein DBB_49460 [Desulfoluna spongiiphila]